MLPLSPLVSVSNQIYNGGRPIAKLSSWDRAACAKTIYEAVRHSDPSQRLRAGYTFEGDPYLAFVTKKSLFSGTIKAYNIVQQRLELRNILFKICEDRLSALDNFRLHERGLVTRFRDQMRAGAPTRDLRVRDVLPVVAILAKRSQQKQIRSERIRILQEAYSPTVNDVRRFERQRITQFLGEGHSTQALLRKALTTKQDKGQEVAEKAIAALVQLFNRFQAAKNVTLRSFVISCASDENLKTFAKRWTHLRDPQASSRKISFIPFSDHPWSLVLDKVASFVLGAAPAQNQGPGKIDGSTSPDRTIYVKSIASSDGTAPAIASVTAQANSPGTPSESAEESDVIVASPIPLQGYQSEPDPAASPMTQLLKTAENPATRFFVSPTEKKKEKSDEKTYRYPDSGRKTTQTKHRKSLAKLRNSTKRLSQVFKSPDKNDYVSRDDLKKWLSDSPSDVWFDFPSRSSPADTTVTKSPMGPTPVQVPPTEQHASMAKAAPDMVSTAAFADQEPLSPSPEPRLKQIESKHVVPDLLASPVPLPLPSNSNSNSGSGSAPASDLSSSSSDVEKKTAVTKD